MFRSLIVVLTALLLAGGAGAQQPVATCEQRLDQALSQGQVCGMMRADVEATLAQALTQIRQVSLALCGPQAACAWDDVLRRLQQLQAQEKELRSQLDQRKHADKPEVTP